MKLPRFESVPFCENEIYTTAMAARILHRHPNTVRDICRRGIIPCRMDRGGYLISGWVIRGYVEGTLPVDRSQPGLREGRGAEASKK